MGSPENNVDEQIIITDALITSAAFHPSIGISILPKFKSEWISSPELRVVFDAAQHYFQKFRTNPTAESLLEYIRLEGKIPGEQVKKLSELIQSLPNIVQPDFFTYQLEKILQGKVLQKTIRDAAILQQEGRYEDIFRLFHKARSESFAGKKDQGSFWDDWHLRDSTLLGDPSPLGFPSLDALLRGGLYPKEMMLVIGAKSAGKSWFGSWIGKSALTHNKLYVIITMEMSRSDLLKRVDCAITNFDYDLYQDHKDQIKDIIFSKREELKGNLIVVEYPSGYPTVPIMENELLEIEQKVGKKVDLVVIDYLDLMRGAVMGGGDDPRRFGLIESSIEIRGMCGRNEMAAIALKQSNALGKKKPFIEAENSAEAFGAAWAPDFVLSINEVVGRPDQRRLYVADSRRTQKKIAILYGVDFGKAQWAEQSGF